MVYDFKHFLILVIFMFVAIVIGLIPGAPSPQCAQNPRQSVLQYVHDVWTTDQGLPQNTVFSMIQSRQGYIWFGTFEGLVRFDGLKFTVFDHSNTPAIKDNWITALYEDDEGRLWIGTGSDRFYTGGGSNVGSLIMLKDDQFTSYELNDGLQNSFVNAISQCSDGNIWVGTRNGLYRFNPDMPGSPRFESFTIKDGLSDNFVTAIYQDRSGTLWVGTLGGLNEGEMSQKEKIIFRIHSDDEIKGKRIYALLQDHRGDVWVGSDDGLVQLSHHDRETHHAEFKMYGTKNGLSHKVVTSLTQDTYRNLWIGTYGGGVNHLNLQSSNEHLSTYGMNEGLSQNVVLCLLEDKEANLWVGTRTGGLNRLREGKMITYTKQNGLHGDGINTIFEDSHGVLWFGNYDGGGLNRFFQGQFTVLTTENGLAENNIRSIFEDKEGALWIGTVASGVSYFKNGQFRTYTTKDGLGGNSVASICEDSKGRIWVGTNGGLNLFKNGRFLSYTTKEGLCSDLIRVLYADRKGRLWIGTHGGLSLLEDGEFHCFTKNEGLSANFVRCIYEDSDGILWIGTQGGGLNRVNTDSAFGHDPRSIYRVLINSYSVQDGLFDNSVFSILDDDHGNFWMSCNKGIYRVSKQQLTDYRKALIPRLQCTAYGTSDGMKNQECNGQSPSAWKTRNGNLWFPTVKGAVMVDPDNIRLNKIPPPVIIEKVIVDGEILRSAEGVVIPAGKNNVEFHFTGLSFSAPEKVQFKYKLEGFDEDWISAESRRVAYYTKISDGELTFKVMACNQDGFWNETGAILHVTVLPPFWKTWWFQTLTALSLFGIFFMTYRIRIRSIEFEKNKLQQLVGQQTEELRQRTRQLEDTLKELRGTQAQLIQSEKMTSLGQMVAGIAHEINNPLTFVHGNLQFVEQALKKIKAEDHEKHTPVDLQEITEALQGSVKGSLRIKKIIEKLKSFSKHEQSTIKETLINKDLEVIIDLFLDQEENIAVEANFDPRLNETKIYCYVAELNQCFYNLLVNSVQAIREAEKSGILISGSGKIRIGTFLNDQQLMIRIQDNGIGISPDAMDKIFEPFFTTRSIGQGEGLGLSEVYGTVKKHGGNVEAKSEVGKGAEFIITLPKAMNNE